LDEEEEAVDFLFWDEAGAALVDMVGVGRKERKGTAAKLKVELSS